MRGVQFGLPHAGEVGLEDHSRLSAGLELEQDVVAVEMDLLGHVGGDAKLHRVAKRGLIATLTLDAPADQRYGDDDVR